jgi:hypothetical protein
MARVKKDADTQTWLFGRVRVDRSKERAQAAAAERREKAQLKKAADDLERAAWKIKDPKKREKAVRDAAAFRHRNGIS